MDVKAGRATPTWARLLLSEHVVLALSLAYVLALGPIVPGFASPENLANIGSNMLPLLVIAIGQTVVLITGGIDLSITATMALASVVGASLITADGGPLADSPLAVPTAVAAMLGVGLAVGLANGASVARLGMPPFMVTLAATMIVGGAAIRYTRSEKIYNLPEPFIAIGHGSIAGASYPLLIVGAIAAATHVALGRTLFGRWLYAIGTNPKAAVISGVPARRVVAAAYVVSGACAAIGSILYTARLETGTPEVSPRLMLDAVGAAVIGGTSLFGGRGKVLWTVYGVLFIALIDNSLNLMNLSNFTIMIAKGAVILLAALLDAARTRYAARS